MGEGAGPRGESGDYMKAWSSKSDSILSEVHQSDNLLYSSIGGRKFVKVHMHFREQMRENSYFSLCQG
jgi:hypothetical protein